MAGPRRAPDRERLTRWSLRDAQTLAAGLGLALPPATLPDADGVRAAEAALSGIRDARAFAATAAAIETAWRKGEAVPEATGDPERTLARGVRERQRLGHYLGAMFHFDGEWYWGLDRLHYLEERLAAINGRAVEYFTPRREVTLQPVTPLRQAVVEAFISLRSPYSYIAMARLIALAEAHNAELRLRPVLPMVMRGLPVPTAKRLYIVRDTKREAERLGLPFGLIADPVGRPAERGLAVTFHAMKTGKGVAFAHSFLKGVFADGIDAGSRKGLLRLCERAGLTAADMEAVLADASWREEAEANREAMLALGIWGVPAFRVDDRPAHWGQDRLWAVEDDLKDPAGDLAAS
ncbi:MAG: DsbA family protein [Oceanicaulis sp.]|uniref:DsbA family protein n=1 Tax=Glycocaulis sp. TaxID=1969725 RepID=UPI0025B9CEDA|nr:DsbA family protein [Glycocaulis sp.]MCC5980578.1 DsbA family protein [Oceanicaulis sp.]MCH8522151.1 DsbA family protein [Glycocaulis sp.]